MEYLSSDKILIVDLTASRTSEDEVNGDLVAERIGGAGLAKSLYEKYESDDPIVLSTGQLTGTLYPASSLGIISARSPRTGKLCHTPFTLTAGIELKYAGFDYVVIKGTSSNPVYLWIHDGVADIADASELWGRDVWNTTDFWRKNLGDDLIQTLVIGPAGETGSDWAQVCLNYWTGGDRFGIGKAFGNKKLKGVALRGMGLLEIADPEGFVDRCLNLLTSLKNGAAAGKQGIGPVCAAMGHPEIQDWLASLVHRHKACYNTPYAANTFVYLDEDPTIRTEPKTDEPGLLITEPYSLIGMHRLGLSAEQACRLLRCCARYGIDPVAVAELSEKAGTKDPKAIEAGFATLSGTPTLPGSGVFSPCTPLQPVFGDFGISGDPSGFHGWWERRQAVAYIFGIDPLFALMSPEITEGNLLELTNVGAELELSQETLDAVIADLME